LDHFVQWDAGATNREWYVYDSGGERVLRRSTNSSSTTLTVYAFGLEEHVYSSSGTNQGNTYYYTLGGRLIGELNGSATQFLLTDALGSVLASVSNVADRAAVQGTSYTYDAEMGRMIVETIHSDGSKNWAELWPGSNEYEQALQAIDAQNTSSSSFLIRDRGQPQRPPPYGRTII
jgi:hypothetical protein